MIRTHLKTRHARRSMVTDLFFNVSIVFCRLQSKTHGDCRLLHFKRSPVKKFFGQKLTIDHLMLLLSY